jgi:branched-chain amino acid transport system ATP-binding protein
LPLLEADGVTVRFGGITALTDVTLDVAAGTITGLIGPNGAGKTTMFNAICGLNNPQEGRLTFEGEDITAHPAHRRARLGIARTFQRLEVFGSLTVLENVLVAREISRRWSKSDSGDLEGEARALVDRVGLGHVERERVDAVPTGYARLVELARALATQPKLLLLDEPSSGLDDSETGRFGELLMELRDEGMAMLLVEHDVELVMRVCDDIHVLEFGRVIARGTAKQIQKDERVQAAYLGEPDAESA